MKSGRVKSLTLLSSPLKMPLLHLPLGKSLLVGGLFFICLLLFYFIFGFLFGFSLTGLVTYLTWRKIYSNYKEDEKYDEIKTQNRKRKKPYKKERFYAS